MPNFKLGNFQLSFSNSQNKPNQKSLSWGGLNASRGGSIKTLESNIKALSNNPKSGFITSIAQTPAWYGFYVMYRIFPFVQSAVTKVANRASTKIFLKAKNGNIHYDFTNKIVREFDLQRWLIEANQQDRVFGQNVTVAFNGDRKDRFKTVPSHEISLIQTAENSFNVSRFNWYQESRFLREIESDFYFSINPNGLDSKLFGDSPLASLKQELDTIDLDLQNFNLYLKNNSFPGIIVKTKSDLTDDDWQVISESVKLLRNPEDRYSAYVMPYGVEGFESLKQDLSQKITPEQKRAIGVMVASCVGIHPLFLISENASGFGQGEQVSILSNYKAETIDNMQLRRADTLNNFIWPLISQELEIEELPKIEIDGYMMPSTPEDWSFEISQMEVQNPIDKEASYKDGFEKGIFTAKEAKLKGYGFADKDLNYDDDFRKLKTSDVIIKEGQLKEGSANSGILDSNNENIADDQDLDTEQMEIDNEQFVKKKVNTDINLKAILDYIHSPNKHEKDRINKFSFADTVNQKAETEEFSKVPDVLKTKEYKDLYEQILKSRSDQYESIDLDKILDEFDFEKSNQKAISTEDPDLLEKITNLVDSEIEDLSSEDSSWKLIAQTLFLISLMGGADLIRQAKENALELTVEQKKSIEPLAKDYITKRIGSLTGDNPKNAKFTPDIRNPYIKNSINTTALKDISSAIYQGVTSAKSKQEAKSIIKTKLAKIAAERSRITAETEAARIFNVGSYLIANLFPVKSKIWLRTQSIDPREIHIKQIGQTIPYNDFFSDGSFLAGELINCKCGIKVIFRKVENKTK